MKERLRRVPVLGTALRVQERYTEDAADALAASIGMFGFLSLFPLLALALAVTGFVVGDDPVAIRRVATSIEQSIPGFAALAGDSGQLREAIELTTENAGGLLSLGTVFLVLAGLRIANGAQIASALVFRVDRPTGLSARGEQAIGLLGAGTMALLGAAVGGSVGVELSTDVADLAGSVLWLAVAYVLDVAMFAVAYRLFTPGPGPAWRTILPGSLLAGAGWLVLKLFGTSYLTTQATDQRSSYGAIGSIIALLLLFYLAGRLYLYGAELAALLAGVDDQPAVPEDGSDRVGDTLVRVRDRGTVSPAPHRDVPPEPADAARLAVSGVVLGVAGRVVGRLLRR